MVFLKRRIFWGQIICLCAAAIGIMGLGIEVFRNNQPSMKVIYIFAALGIVGFVGNAVLAVYKIYAMLKK